ncbi:16S rRNA (guanine(527)-N(7))-methyltransferase RsmG [Candidatus Saccharibacteria bacterium]|nr:16S rRNA (guanine(527)-N(7))-methyltransferase RsmG [Candidatus Saccharibacteria bacterium]
MEATLSALHAHDIQISDQQSALLARFVDSFMAYNAHTNISAIRQPEAIWTKHIADSLMLLKFEDISGSAIDIGTGGGLPGIPLAIMRPTQPMFLLDSVGKKIKACQSFIEELGLENTRTILGRAEKIAKDSQHKHNYDTVLSRATAYLPILLAWSEHLLAPGGRIIMYKTPSDEERQAGTAVAKELKLTLAREHRYELEGQQRYILVYERTSTVKQRK